MTCITNLLQVSSANSRRGIVQAFGKFGGHEDSPRMVVRGKGKEQTRDMEGVGTPFRRGLRVS